MRKQEKLGARKEREYLDLANLSRQKELSGFQDKQCIHRETRSMVWISAIPHRLNCMELSCEAFRDNLCLRYLLMPHDISATCNCCGKRFLIKHALS